MNRFTLVAASVVLASLSLTAPAAAQFGVGGGAGTSTLLDEEFLAGGSDRELFKSTKEGLPDSGMPAFGETMSDPQIWSLVVYIRELQHRDRRARLGSPKPDQSGVYTSQHHKFRVEPVVTEGLTVPWSVAFLPDGRMLIAERPGTLRIHSTGKPGGELGEPVEGTPAVRSRGQGGLMEVILHPQYEQNGWVYLSFSDRDERNNGMTKIVRGRIKPSADGLAHTWTDQETIFQAKPEHYLRTDLHFGCRIAFEEASDGKYNLYFTIGERGMGPHAQDLSRPNGKVHRVTDDGKIPADNPFVGDAKAYPSIWSYGHRNPQGLVFDARGNLWNTEHGPRGGDELNLIKKSLNYGWPIVTFGMNYNGAPLTTPWPPEGQDLEMPVDRWMPSIGACGLGLAEGNAFPNWSGDLLAGGLSGMNVDRIRVREEAGTPVVAEREELIHGLGRVRTVLSGPDGTVYVVLNGPDQVIRLIPADD